MTKTVVCVFRSGGEYTEAHVLRLRDQVLKHNPDVRFVVLADKVVEGCERYPLAYDWPGWWSKMEIFSPYFSALLGDFLYMDLDTTVCGDISQLFGSKKPMIMRDVYRPTGLQSSIMWIPAAEAPMVWKRWFAAPEHYISRHQAGGDQEFLETIWLSKALRFQDWVSGIVSYKADKVAERGTQGASVVVFHGKPRPWQVPEL